MKITSLNTDEAVLGELGRRLSNYRILRELTQAQLAEATGVSKRTIERLEAGESVQLSNLIRVVRVLDRMDSFDRFLPDAPPNPIDLLERQGKTRQRVRGDGSPAGEDERKPWSWGDES
jgi:transcriptional regulator with XRE-family HTH domain